MQTTLPGSRVGLTGSSVERWVPAGQWARLGGSKQGDFVVFRTHLKFCYRALSVSGPIEWNSLPASVRHAHHSVTQFKLKLKFQTFSLYYDYKNVALCRNMLWCKICFFKMRYNCSFVLYNIVLYCIVLYCILLYCKKTAD